MAGFALPDPAGIDPTNLMMPFFVCFFGMMVSDAGYGLMMAILIPILIKIMQPGVGLRKLMLVLFGGGIATVFWGALYNTWFGFAAIPALGLFDAVNNSMPVMAPVPYTHLRAHETLRHPVRPLLLETNKPT